MTLLPAMTLGYETGGPRKWNALRPNTALLIAGDKTRLGALVSRPFTCYFLITTKYNSRTCFYVIRDDGRLRDDKTKIQFCLSAWASFMIFVNF
jgi:hypothetical protein